MVPARCGLLGLCLGAVLCLPSSGLADSIQLVQQVVHVRHDWWPWRPKEDGLKTINLVDARSLEGADGLPGDIYVTAPPQGEAAEEALADPEPEEPMPAVEEPKAPEASAEPQAAVPSAPAAEEAQPAEAPVAEPAVAEQTAEPASLERHTDVAKQRVQVEFQLGETVQVLDMSGRDTNGTWAQCTIVGKGNFSNSYNIHVSDAPEGFQDYSNVPAGYLRRFEPPPETIGFFAFEVGDTMEVKSASGPSAGDWIPCNITSRGPAMDMYGIHVPVAPPGHRDISGVPASMLRPFARDAFERVVEHMRFDPYAVNNFEAGDAAQVKVETGPMAGKWMNCKITGTGSRSNTFDIHLPFPAPSGTDLHDVHYVSLRKMPSWSVGQEAEVLIRDGPRAGQWIQVNVSGVGSKPNWYNIHTGRQEIRDIPALALRPRRKRREAITTPAPEHEETPLDFSPAL